MFLLCGGGGVFYHSNRNENGAAGLLSSSDTCLEHSYCLPFWMFVPPVVTLLLLPRDWERWGGLGVEITLVSLFLLCLLLQEWYVFAEDSGVGTDGLGSASACPSSF